MRVQLCDPIGPHQDTLNRHCPSSAFLILSASMPCRRDVRPDLQGHPERGPDRVAPGPDRRGRGQPHFSTAGGLPPLDEQLPVGPTEPVRPRMRRGLADGSSRQDRFGSWDISADRSSRFSSGKVLQSASLAERRVDGRAAGEVESSRSASRWKAISVVCSFRLWRRAWWSRSRAAGMNSLARNRTSQQASSPACYACWLVLFRRNGATLAERIPSGP